MTDERDADQTQGGAELQARQGEATVAALASADDAATTDSRRRDPATTLAGCERILILGRTGSGKTTLARELAAALGVPHVELDSLYFGPDFSRAPLPVLRERTSAAIAGDRWVTDGNKRAVRDLVWPRADTIVWLDYPRLCEPVAARQTRAHAAPPRSTRRPRESGEGPGCPGRCSRPREGCSRRSDPTGDSAGSTRGCSPQPANQHLAVARLRSPRATRQWMARVTDAARTSS